MARNALLIVVDQWRFDALRCLGDEIVRSPNVDRLCARGVTFRNAFTVIAPCGPARASLLTGLYGFRHGVLRNGYPPKPGVRFVTESFEAQGILPILCGYTTTAPTVGPSGRGTARVAHGLNYHEGFYPLAAMIPQRFPYRTFLASKGVEIPEPFEDIWRPDDTDFIPEGYGLTAQRARLPVEHWDNAFYAGAADAFLKSGTPGPWFLMLTFMRPHPPFIVPAPFHRLHHPDDMPMPQRAATPEAEAAADPRIADWIAHNTVSGIVQGGTGLARDLSDLDTRQIRATYYGMMAELDAQIGHVLDALEARADADETLVILTSDHGELLGDHWLFGKQAWFDPAFRIPMIVSDPTAPAQHGAVADDMVECADVAATLIDWFGTDHGAATDGRSLLPRATQGTPLGRERVFFELDDPGGRAMGLHDGSEKLIFALNGPHAGHHLRYDLASDPHELAPQATLTAEHRDRLIEVLAS